jgi:hypothetical protein
MAHETVLLPDGYNGHLLSFFTKPLETDGDLVKLQCADPGKQNLFAWKLRSYVVSSWMIQQAMPAEPESELEYLRRTGAH